MNKQDERTVLDALEYVKGVLETLPTADIVHCKMKISAHTNIEIILKMLNDAWENKTAEEPQEV